MHENEAGRGGRGIQQEQELSATGRGLQMGSLRQEPEQMSIPCKFLADMIERLSDRKKILSMKDSAKLLRSL